MPDAGICCSTTREGVCVLLRCQGGVDQGAREQRPHRAQALQAGVGVGGAQLLELLAGQGRRAPRGAAPGPLDRPGAQVVADVQLQQRWQVGVRPQHPLLAPLTS